MPESSVRLIDGARVADATPSLRPLTGSRFLAALAVFLHHWEGGRYFYEGFSGVSFFFLLSGFILTYNYRDRFRSLRPGAVCRFYIARLARIYPVHVLSFAAVLPFVYADVLAGPRRALRQALLNLTLTQSFIPRTPYYYSYNTVSWSLSDEWFFYLLMPFLLPALARLVGSNLGRALGAGVAVWALILGLAWHWRVNPELHWLIYVCPLTRTLDFGLGILLCLAFSSRRQTSRPPSPRWAATLAELLALAALAAAFTCAGHISFPMRLGPYYTPAMALVVWVFAFQRGWLSALLGSRVCVFLGEISFSFYMFHALVLNYLGKYRIALRLGSCGPMAAGAVALATTLAISSICFVCYERPIREWVKHRLQRRRVPLNPPLRQAA